jgi:predicted TIM-barrel fold metal-dependent hydrolase
MSERLLVVSTDSHAGPSLRLQLREYCPSSSLADFDEFVNEMDRLAGPLDERTLRQDEFVLRRGLLGSLSTENSDSAWSERTEGNRKALEYLKGCQGLQDPKARLADMDADGVAVDVIFAGGQNGEILPFLGFGTSAGAPERSAELRAVGAHIWNAWLADFVSTAPERHVGVMQIPIWDIAKSVRENEWAFDAGLRAVNLPAPRADYPPYTDPSYEPVWAACAARRLPLLTHTGGGEKPLGFPAKVGLAALYRTEVHWLSRRGLWQLIFGGVFERYPDLKFVLTEQGVTWVPEQLRDLDSVYLCDSDQEIRQSLPRRPSEYWSTNCFLSGSFLARYEVEARYSVGVGNLMWGSDYPHVEGTWPRTLLAMRNTLAGLPVDEIRQILGETAVDVYNLDHEVVMRTASRIGPMLRDVTTPLDPEEMPKRRGEAFREVGQYA